MAREFPTRRWLLVELARARNWLFVQSARKKRRLLVEVARAKVVWPDIKSSFEFKVGLWLFLALIAAIAVLSVLRGR
jgi:hypothetical protein